MLIKEKAVKNRRPHFVFFLFLALAGCQLATVRETDVTFDAMLRRAPAVKTAVIHLLNADLTANDIEYLQFYDRLKPVLEANGYRLTSPAAVILRLKFGVEKVGTASVKSDIVTPDIDLGDEYTTPKTLYDRRAVYDKYIALTAVRADKSTEPLWKVTVSKRDFSPDFRSAQDRLLYVLSHLIEKDTGRRVTAALPDTETLSRPDTREAYARRLQAKIDADKAAFAKCGLDKDLKLPVKITALGTLPADGEAYNITNRRVSAETKACVRAVLRPMIDLPVDIDLADPFVLTVPASKQN